MTSDPKLGISDQKFFISRQKLFLSEQKFYYSLNLWKSYFILILILTWLGNVYGVVVTAWVFKLKVRIAGGGFRRSVICGGNPPSTILTFNIKTQAVSTTPYTLPSHVFMMSCDEIIIRYVKKIFFIITHHNIIKIKNKHDVQ